MRVSGTDRVDEALAADQIIVGWSLAEGLLDPALDEEDFRRIVHEAYHTDEESMRKAGQAAPQLWRFIREFSAEDVILVPRGPNFYLAKLTDDTPLYLWEFRDEDTSYRRNVEWSNDKKPTPRSMLSEPLQARLNKLRNVSVEITEFLDELEIATEVEQTDGEDWTSHEIEAAVLDYRDMLAKEFANIAYNKSEHRRALMKRVSRSKGSIEFKHQNISAVLQEVGKPWIVGYKPRRNFQNALVDTVERLLLNDFEMLPDKRIPKVADFDKGVFVAPPRAAERSETKSVRVERLAIKIDQAERDRRNRDLGDAGEDFVVEIEKNRLASRPDLAARVERVSKTRGDGLGYDVLSFEDDGRERRIEVKTTRGGIGTPFYVSAGEVAAAKDYGDCYRLYRVFSYGRTARIYEIVAPLDEYLALTPCVFVARPRR
jgi:Domain of unknown function (DUF3883)